MLHILPEISEELAETGAALGTALRSDGEGAVLPRGRAGDAGVRNPEGNPVGLGGPRDGAFGGGVAVAAALALAWRPL